MIRFGFGKMFSPNKCKLTSINSNQIEIETTSQQYVLFTLFLQDAAILLCCGESTDNEMLLINKNVYLI